VAGPVWLTGLFAAVMITVAAYCTARLIAARRWRRPTEVDTDGNHIVMGVAMAGMLAARLRVLPPGVWEAVFAVSAVWFGWQLLRARRGAPMSPWRCLHPMPHLVECAAMVYMFAVLPASLVASRAASSAAGGMSGMSASSAQSRFSVLALVLALFMFGYVVWLGDRFSASAPAVKFAFLPARRAAVAPAFVAGIPSTDPGRDRGNKEAPTPTPGRTHADSPLPRLAPRCAALCQVAMAITMGYMLIMLL
jgi:hypothetical protein